MFSSDAALGGGGSRPGSRAGFRRPGEDPSETRPSVDAASSSTGGNRVDHLRGATSSSFSRPTSAPSTPIPSVLPPTFHRPSTSDKPPLSPSSLNKLQAGVLKARLMGSDDADALEKEYEAERERSRTSGGRTAGVEKEGVRTEMMPTLDGMGRLYDVGKGEEEVKILPGNRKKKEKVRLRILFVSLSKDAHRFLFSFRSRPAIPRPATSFVSTPTMTRQPSEISYAKSALAAERRRRRTWTPRWRTPSQAILGSRSVRFCVQTRE